MSTARWLPLISCAATLACTAQNPLFNVGDAGGLGGADGGQGGRGGAPTDAPMGQPDQAGAGGAPGIDTSPPEASPELPPGPTPLGQPCTTGASCASGTCVHGVCCNSDCRDRCWSCTLPASLGTCTIVPAEEDPHDDCPAEAVATCGRTGACNGAGACSLHAAGTECRPRTCAAAIETPANTCDGAGQCLGKAAVSCGALGCTTDRCAVGCSAGAPCANGFQCVGGNCQATGVALHWRFDEPSGTTATDASGNGFHGTYSGEPTTPQPSANVPTTKFANPSSRAFAASGRPSVILSNLDARLMPTNGFSVSVWYRTGSVPATSFDVVNLNTDIMVRLYPDRIEFVKRKSNVAGMLYTIAAARDLNHLDGKWHHVAGVASPGGVDLYFDGALRKHDGDASSIVWHTSPTLWVGRDGVTETREFSGEIDDFRIYARALDAAEIKKIATGDL